MLLPLELSFIAVLACANESLGQPEGQGFHTETEGRTVPTAPLLTKNQQDMADKIFLLCFWFLKVCKFASVASKPTF